MSRRCLGALPLSVIETVLFFAVLPAAVVLAMFGLIYAGSARTARRYRPGRPFAYRPVWFLSAPEQVKLSDDGRRELAAGGERRALPGSERTTGWPTEDPTVVQGATGGASDRW